MPKTHKTPGNDYDISRSDAATICGKSVRTIDRLIKSKSIASRTINGRIWLSKKEIEGLAKIRKEAKSVKVDTKVDKNEMSIDIGKSKVLPGQNEEMVEQNAPIFSELSSLSIDKNILDLYKGLYEELKEQCRQNQERIEAANYRVGYLEAQLKTAMPSPEMIEQQIMLETKTAVLSKELKSKENELNDRLVDLTALQKLVRNLVIVLLFLMTLQPLWSWLSNIK